MRSALAKDLWRTILRKPGRFFALFVIVALGSGFYAGLRMTSPDMDIALDRYLDGARVYDLRIVSTMGLDEEDGPALRALPAVQDVMLAYETDVMVQAGELSYTVRIHSYPASAPAAQVAEDGFTVESEDSAYLNRLVLAEGRWPTAPDECLVSADRVAGSEFALGESVFCTQGVGNLDSTLVTRRFTIVGSVHMPYYVSSAGIDTCSLGSGVVQQVFYVPEESFAEAYPYTEAFVAVEGARQARFQAKAYDELIEEAKAQVAGIADERCELRYEHLVDQMYGNATSFDGLFDLAEYRFGMSQEDLDNPVKPEWLVLGREKNPGTYSFMSDADRVDHIASLFPFIFFLVAALVALTTMTRMVDEERLFVGTCKALGYTRARIAGKYLLYALVASGAGAVVGIVVLGKVLPVVIMYAYAIIYYVPHGPLPIDMPLAMLSGGLSLGITLGVTWLSALATLRERPAALLVARAPKMGKRILLERIGPIWKRLSFTWKVTFRNLFRYKKRFVMTVIGIAGCTALLLTGLGLRDSINDIIDVQYGEIVHYNAQVTLNDKMPAAQQARLQEVLDEPALVDGYTWAGVETMLAAGPRAQDKRIDVVVPADNAALQNLKTLRTRNGHEPIALGRGTAVLNEKLAQELGLAMGDDLVLRRQDSMGNAMGEEYRVAVGALCENYIYNYLYLDTADYEAVFGRPCAMNAVYANVVSDGAAREDFAAALERIKGVKTISYNDDTIEMYRESLRSVNLIVVVLVVAAAVLAFVVLYNLTNINIEERIREIATLKVLGFTRAETRSYIFREIVLLAVMGALLGLVLGVFLENFVVVSAEVDQVMFGRTIHWPSFIWAFAGTLAFSVASMGIMVPKLARVDMVASLKSNE